MTVLDPATTADALDVLAEIPLWTLAPAQWDAVTRDLGVLTDAVRYKETGDARAAVDRLLLAEPSRVTPIGAEPAVPAPPPVRERIALLVHALLGDGGDRRATGTR
ncbi:hypothetical protein DMA12_21070 [Amycolatopsis balhimycina DSM 5908]|uniref:CATRA-Associated Small Protein domain-containing protein n=1 Tax=Amycolatopsis balhimycina DSM 5908 TaxID=1081091 RepID=A0A428WI69_AMYBA|nr:CATRA system-associated protein [Amycolatopsis balhimycina]RSM42713.1 hypothetical protein DMA12_21070 [Amycolatopsis balhimycina DSM 5908]